MGQWQTSFGVRRSALSDDKYRNRAFARLLLLISLSFNSGVAVLTAIIELFVWLVTGLFLAIFVAVALLGGALAPSKGRFVLLTGVKVR
jgi:hypothetical protein